MKINTTILIIGMLLVAISVSACTKSVEKQSLLDSPAKEDPVDSTDLIIDETSLEIEQVTDEDIVVSDTIPE